MTPVFTSTAMAIDCQNEKKTTALTLTNFQKGLIGASSLYITL